MKRRYSLLALGVVLLSGCASVPQPQPARELAATRLMAPVEPGAWQVLAIDARARRLADYALASLGDSQADPLQRIVEVRAQPVSGTRYALLLELASGARWQVGLYQDSDGLLQLIERRRI